MKKTNMRFSILILLFIFITLHFFPKPALANTQIEAAEIMKKSLAVIKESRLIKGLPIDYALDPNGTGIIGEEFTELTTTLGKVEDKRSSANPDFAAMMVAYFNQAGLKQGDTVCIGASGSFPALLLATLSAARALHLRPLVIYSIGASMYGANLPQFTFLDMMKELSKEEILPFSIVAVSMGGHNDMAEGMFFPEAQKEIRKIAERSGLHLIHEKSIDESIKKSS